MARLDDGQAVAGDTAARQLRPDPENASPLSQALEMAAQSIPRAQQGSVILISDGLATSRNWAKPVAQLAERGIPVHVYNPAEVTSDPFPAALRFAPARPGESLRVTTVVIGSDTGMQLVLRAGEEELARSEPFRGKGRHFIDLEFDAGEPGFLDVTAELLVAQSLGDDSDNNRLEGVAAIQSPVRILYVGQRQQGAAERLVELLGPGHAIDTANPDELNGNTDLDPYQLVMLDDVPARLLSEEFQAHLSGAIVDAGLGLMMSGGEASFADGGYFEAPVAELLPVEITGEDDISDPSVGLALILDTSGSMGGTRIELAKQIARIAVRRLQPHDRIGIVEFYGAKHWAVPMQPASNKIEIDRAIGRMKAIGGTVLFPAIQEAYYGLRNINTRYKHIILVTDAGVEDRELPGHGAAHLPGQHQCIHHPGRPGRPQSHHGRHRQLGTGPLLRRKQPVQPGGVGSQTAFGTQGGPLQEGQLQRGRPERPRLVGTCRSNCPAAAERLRPG